MIHYLRSTQANPVIKTGDLFQSGSWIRCERPNDEELQVLIGLGLDEDILADALDPHEVPRVESYEGWTYFITRLPDTDDDFNDFTTPILFAMGKDSLATVSRDSLGRLWQPFIDKTQAPTSQQTMLFLLMVDAIIRQYQTRMASINRQMRAASSDVRNLGSKDIATLTDYERKLNDYLDALLPTNTAIEKLLGGKLLKLYEEDRSLVEDVSIDLEQLIARCKSLLRTIHNTRDSYRALMDTRLNETVRLLTVFTLALTIPTMLAGLYGMNIPLPAGAHSPYMFWVIITTSILSAFVLAFYFLRKR